MPNALDTFFDKGNTWFANLANDTITWDGDDYAGTVSDLNKDLFFDDDGAGKKRNAERLLEFAVSVFSSSLPAIGDTITYLTDTYQIIEIESQDTTNIVYRIRQKMGAAT